MTTADRLGTILSIWAHPDDETWLSAGVMAAARDNGQRVVCASATAGERGTPDPEAWPPARLGRMRRWEAAAAMAVLGVEEHTVHGLPDGGLVEHEQDGSTWAADLLGAVQPDTILTFGPEGMTYHPDHLAVHRWVTRAWRETGCSARLLYATPTAESLSRFGELFEEWEMFMSDERPDGVPCDALALHLGLDGAGLDRKVAALSAMVTQTRDLVSAVDEETFRALLAEESFVSATPSPAKIVSDLNAWVNPYPELGHLRGADGLAHRSPEK